MQQHLPLLSMHTQDDRKDIQVDPELQALLDSIDADVSALSVEELNEGRAQIVEMGQELREVDAAGLTKPEQAQLSKDAVALSEKVKAIDGELQARTEAASETAAAVAEALAFTDEDSDEETDSETSDDDDDEESDEEESDEEEDEATSEEEAAAEAAIAADPDIEDLTEPVAASATPLPALREVKARRPAMAAPRPSRANDGAVALVAAAIGDDGLGSQYPDREAAAHAVWNAHRRMGANAMDHVVLRIDNRSKYEVGGKGTNVYDNWETLEEIRKGTQAIRQKGGLDVHALIAAGFCAPVEPIYEYWDSGTRDGLWNGPSATAARGQISYPDIVSAFDDLGAPGIAGAPAFQGVDDGVTTPDGVGDVHTAAADLIPTAKTCFVVACGTDTTYEVEGKYTCVTFSNFDELFYPERVTKVLNETMLSHDHSVNFQHLAAITAAATALAAPAIATGQSSFVTLVNALVQHVAAVKEANRLAQNSVFELLLPYWVQHALAVDLLARQSTMDYGRSVAYINDTLSAHGFNIQWLYDYQLPAAYNLWNATVNAIIYPAGTVVRLTGGVIDVGVTRDSTLNVANDFQIFVERFEGIATPGDPNQLRSITGIDVTPAGGTYMMVDPDASAPGPPTLG